LKVAVTETDFKYHLRLKKMQSNPAYMK